VVVRPLIQGIWEKLNQKCGRPWQCCWIRGGEPSHSPRQCRGSHCCSESGFENREPSSRVRHLLRSSDLQAVQVIWVLLA
jgi:hypothetical protein